VNVNHSNTLFLGVCCSSVELEELFAPVLGVYTPTLLLGVCGSSVDWYHMHTG